MKRRKGISFDGVHTYERWKLGLLSIEKTYPEIKKITEPIPGSDLFIDLTESLDGEVHYEPRKLTFTFDAMDCDYECWETLLSDIADELHGQNKKIILDTDPSFYYVGRCVVSTNKSNPITAEVVIEAEVEPYKYEMFSSLEDWDWDSFNFETGIIREYRDLTVDGSLTLTIEGRRKRVIPTFAVNSVDGSGLKVKFEGATYDLPDGNVRVLNIAIRQGENTLLFSGNGTVSVDYRGGRL